MKLNFFYSVVWNLFKRYLFIHNRCIFVPKSYILLRKTYKRKSGPCCKHTFWKGTTSESFVPLPLRVMNIWQKKYQQHCNKHILCLLMKSFFLAFIWPQTHPVWGSTSIWQLNTIVFVSEWVHVFLFLNNLWWLFFDPKTQLISAVF